MRNQQEVHMPIPENAARVKLPRTKGVYFVSDDPVKAGYTHVRDVFGKDGTSYKFTPDYVIATSHSRDPHYDGKVTIFNNPTQEFWDEQKVLRALIAKIPEESFRSVGDAASEKRDLSTPTLRAPIFEKAKKLNALNDLFMGNRESVELYLPGFEKFFSSKFNKTLVDLAEGRGEITGKDLLLAYEQTIDDMHPIYETIRPEMSIQQAYTRMLDYFEVPFQAKLVEELAAKYPDAAKTYELQFKRWTEGTRGEPI